MFNLTNYSFGTGNGEYYILPMVGRVMPEHFLVIIRKARNHFMTQKLLWSNIDLVKKSTAISTLKLISASDLKDLIMYLSSHILMTTIIWKVLSVIPQFGVL